MENKFKESRLIEQIMVLGEGEKMPGAFIVPDFQALRVWCEHNQIDYTTDAQMTEHPDVLKKYDEEVSHYNEQFAPYEQVKKFVLMKEAWSVDGGELTATMKLKRKPVLSKYEQKYNEIYS